MSNPPETTREVSLSQYPWEWKEAVDSAPWSKCTTFPTVIHHELQAATRIPDPFIGDNERKIQWVGWKDWSFRTYFATPENTKHLINAFLAFDGLDTFVKVELNGMLILESNNMFIPQRVDIQDKLRPEKKVNELVITFESAMRRGKEREEQYGKKMSMLRDSSRLYVRKAQYHWGWDWGRLRICKSVGSWVNVCRSC
jgi:beta-mannosidase